MPPDPAEDVEDPLAALLVDEVPGDFALVGEDRPGLGPLDLAEAAAVEDDPAAERAVLETRGFERGYAQGWRGPEGAVVYTMVDRFGTA